MILHDKFVRRVLFASPDPLYSPPNR